MDGKVTILVPVYYRCPMLCTQTLNGLLEALRQMPPDFTAGGKFNIVTFSLDPKEHHSLARDKKAVYLDEYGRPGAEQGWRFLTGTKETVQAVTEAVGYRYEYDRAFKEYNHPSGLIILTPEGKVARYFYGIGFDQEYKIPGGTTTLRLSLVEASDGKIGSLSDKLILLCYRFDHTKGYAFQIMRAVQIGGVLTLILMLTGITVALRRERRRRETLDPVAVAAETTTRQNDGPPSGGTV
jgi:protein SCO1/2